MGNIKWQDVLLAALRAALLAVLTLLADAQVQGQLTALLRVPLGDELVPPQVVPDHKPSASNSTASGQTP